MQDARLELSYSLLNNPDHCEVNLITTLSLLPPNAGSRPLLLINVGTRLGGASTTIRYVQRVPFETAPLAGSSSLARYNPNNHIFHLHQQKRQPRHQLQQKEI
jgi:hypothetical protein